MNMNAYVSMLEPPLAQWLSMRRCTWVVKVELALERLSLLFRGQGPVEAVLAEDGHLPLVVVDLVLAQQLHDLTAHRRLNTNKESETSDPRYTI